MDILPYGCGVIAIFSLIFLFYTNSFLIKRRYREFGLYNVLGMDKQNISRLLLWEGIYTAGISIGAGLVCGMAFSKAAELVLLNILDGEISFTLHIGVISLIVTALVYLGIYGLLLINSFTKVRRSKPLELMQSSRAGEKKLKCNWLFATLGAGLFGYAYYLAVSIEDPTSALLVFFVAVIMVIIATYLVDAVHYDKVGYLCVLPLADYNNMMGENKTLESGECLIYSDRLELPWKTFTMEYGKTYSVKERLTAFKVDGVNATMVVPYVYLVVPDIAAFVEPVVDLQNSYGYSVLNYNWLLGFDCSNAEEEIAVNNALFSAFMEQNADDHPWDFLSLESREEERFSFYEMYGSLFFLGIMLSIVFLMAAVLIIYYKQISEGYEDQIRFEIMQKSA